MFSGPTSNVAPSGSYEEKNKHKASQFTGRLQVGRAQRRRQPLSCDTGAALLRFPGSHAGVMPKEFSDDAGCVIDMLLCSVRPVSPPRLHVASPSGFFAERQIEKTNKVCALSLHTTASVVQCLLDSIQSSQWNGA